MRTGRQWDSNWAVSRLLMLQVLILHTGRRWCSCVKNGNKCGPGCRCKNCCNTPSAKGTQQPSSNSLVEVEEEELLHDNSLKKTYGEVCVSDDEGGDCGSSVMLTRMTWTTLSTSHTQLPKMIDCTSLYVVLKPCLRLWLYAWLTRLRYIHK